MAPKRIRKPTGIPCKIEGCDRSHVARGFCQRHYRRWKKHGDPLRIHYDLDWRLDARTKKTKSKRGCWLWMGTRAPAGYGILCYKGKYQRVHRLMYERYRGLIPPGLVLDHLCRNPPCVNPDHLEPVTDAENCRRGMSPPAKNARLKRCRRGHKFMLKPNGRRQCMTCQTAARKRMEAKRKALAALAAKRGEVET